MPITSYDKGTCSNVSLSKISEGMQNCLSLWPAQQRNRGQHSNEHVTKYKNMRKWMVEFLTKSESRDDKIVRVNSIRISKYINLL